MLSHESKHLQLATLTLVAEQSLLSHSSLLGRDQCLGSWQYQEAIISVVGSEQYDMESKLT